MRHEVQKFQQEVCGDAMGTFLRFGAIRQQHAFRKKVVLEDPEEGELSRATSYFRGMLVNSS